MKLFKRTLSILSCAALLCGSAAIPASAANRATADIFRNTEKNVKNLEAQLSKGDAKIGTAVLSEAVIDAINKDKLLDETRPVLDPDLGLSKKPFYPQYPGHKIPPKEPVLPIDTSLKASQVYKNRTLTQSEIDAGRKVTLEVKVKNREYLLDGYSIHYQWFKKGRRNIAIDNSDSPILETSSPGEYYCEVWAMKDNRSPFAQENALFSKNSVITTDIATVELVDELSVVTLPEDMPLYDKNYGAELNITVTGGSGKYNYEWYNTYSPNYIRGTGKSFITYYHGDYFCVVTDADNPERTISTIDTPAKVKECYYYPNPKCTKDEFYNVGEDGDIGFFSISFYAELYNENLKTEFYFEVEEADIRKDNWKTIYDFGMVDGMIWKESNEVNGGDIVLLNVEAGKEYRFNAYIYVNGRRCGMVSSGKQYYTLPIEVKFNRWYYNPGDGEYYAELDYTGGYGSLEFESDSSWLGGEVFKDDKGNVIFGNSHKLHCKAQEYDKVDGKISKFRIDYKIRDVFKNEKSPAYYEEWITID